MTDITIKNALNAALHEEMARDEAVICIGEDIRGDTGADNPEREGGVFGVTAGLAHRFGPDRVIDTPISETAFLGMAIGAAMTGMRPVVEIMFCDFMGVCFDQLMNQAAKARFLSNDRINLPLTIRTTMGAGDGSGAMHSASLHGLFGSIPGLTVACPSTPNDADGILRAAIRGNDPVVILEHKGLYDHRGERPKGLPIKLGLGRKVMEGDDVTIVAVSSHLETAKSAAGEIGVSADIIDPITINPLDKNLILSSIQKTGRLLVVDEGPAHIGFASAVVSMVSQEAFSDLKAAPVVVCPPATPVPYASKAETEWLPNQSKVIDALQKLVASK